MRARHPQGDGPSIKQRYALVAAKSGKLFQTRDGLRFREASHRTLPVRTFGPAIVKACLKLGWVQEMDQGDGSTRIMTTLAGDAALARKMRRVIPNAFPSGQREALR